MLRTQNVFFSRASPFGLLVSAVQVVQNRRSFIQNDLAVQVVGSWVVIVLRDELELRLALFLPGGKHNVRTAVSNLSLWESIRARVCV